MHLSKIVAAVTVLAASAVWTGAAQAIPAFAQIHFRVSLGYITARLRCAWCASTHVTLEAVVMRYRETATG